MQTTDAGFVPLADLGDVADALNRIADAIFLLAQVTAHPDGQEDEEAEGFGSLSDH